MASKKILIVEDEILIADTIERYLKKRGYLVVGIAISYDEAVRLYSSETPDLVLLDIRLFGEKNGLDVAQFIQEQAHPKPYIFLTSQIAGSKVIEQANALSPAGYISKPIIRSRLFTVVSEVLGEVKE